MVNNQVEYVAVLRFHGHKLHLAVAYLLAGVVRAAEDVIDEREVAVRRKTAKQGQRRLRYRLGGHADARNGAARLVAAVFVRGVVRTRWYGKAQRERGGAEKRCEFTHRRHLRE